MRGLAKTSRSDGAMELVDREVPEPAPDEALIEVDYAGLCGSDAGIYEFESAFERMNLPNVVGYEYTGRAVEVGDAVTKFSVGDRVAEFPEETIHLFDEASGSAVKNRRLSFTGTVEGTVP